MIINLVGPPAAGKSTFASKFVLNHPEFKYCSIDAYRVDYENEDVAWRRLYEDVLANKNTVLETSGLGWRLHDIFSSGTVLKRQTYTVLFTIRESCQILIDRLSERQNKRPLPEPYTKQDEMYALQFVLENMHDLVTEPDYTVYTDKWTTEEQYEEVAKRINQRRILGETKSIKEKRSALRKPTVGGRRRQTQTPLV